MNICQSPTYKSCVSRSTILYFLFLITKVNLFFIYISSLSVDTYIISYKGGCVNCLF
nr:MAG TPA: hypothetical protein [Caudoviricetes sp.]